MTSCDNPESQVHSEELSRILRLCTAKVRAGGPAPPERGVLLESLQASAGLDSPVPQPCHADCHCPTPAITQLCQSPESQPLLSTGRELCWGGMHTPREGRTLWGTALSFLQRSQTGCLVGAKRSCQSRATCPLAWGPVGPCGSGASGGSGSGRLPGDTDTPRSRGTWLPARARGWDVARGQRPAAPIIPDPPWPDGLCRLSLGLDSPDGAGRGAACLQGARSTWRQLF